jgi:hypothetical protein
VPILGLGLMLSGLAVLGVSWLSYAAGYPVEVALLRGLLAFIAVNFLAYLGELIVATAPPVAAAEDAAGERGGAGRMAAPRDPMEQVEGLPTNLVPAAAPSREPIPIRPDVDIDERQAA